MNNKKFHYAWIVMIGCALTQIGSLGAVVYSVGAFYGPVAEALGGGRGAHLRELEQEVFS